MRDSKALTRTTVETVWRIEAPRLIGGLVRFVRDLDRAEDLAQEALLTALECWPGTGIPDNPGAWLMTTAKNRAVDAARRRAMMDGKHGEIERSAPKWTTLDVGALDGPVGDDVLRLVLITCHPVLSKDARVALTLRLVAGLSTAEIARAFLTTESTIAQRIVRAKRILSEARVPFEVPSGDDLRARVPPALEVVYLIFNEGYAATAGDDWFRPELCEEAMRLGRLLTGLVPDEPEVHGLQALMELQASRSRARTGAGGAPVLLFDQDRGKMGPPAHHARPRRPGTRRGAGPAARSVHAAGGDRRLPRARTHARGDGLDADRRALRRARRDYGFPRGRTEPGGRDCDGLRPGGGSLARRRTGARSGASELPPAARGSR